MMDTIVATYWSEVNATRVYVWSSGTETWQDFEGHWRHRHIMSPKDVIHESLVAEVAD